MSNLVIKQEPVVKVESNTNMAAVVKTETMSVTPLSSPSMVAGYPMNYYGMAGGVRRNKWAYGRVAFQPIKRKANTPPPLEKMKKPASAKSSRHRGVYWEKAAKKWHASITHEGKRRHLGRFVEEDAAARAVKEAEEARAAGKLGEHLEMKRELRKASNTSKHKGVSWNKKHKKWETHITFNGKQHYLGSYSEEDEAAKVVRAAESRRTEGTLGEYLIERKKNRVQRKKVSKTVVLPTRQRSTRRRKLSDKARQMAAFEKSIDQTLEIGMKRSRESSVESSPRSAKRVRTEQSIELQIPALEPIVEPRFAFRG